MSEFRVEKQRARATLMLSTGGTVEGHFFLSGGAPTHTGPERVIDLLNAETSFFPFEVAARGEEPAHTAVYNRTHVVMVHLPARDLALERDPSYSMAPQRAVSIQLSTGARLSGVVHVVRPAGHDRLSDYAGEYAGFHELFRPIEGPDHTLIINTAYIVTLSET